MKQEEKELLIKDLCSRLPYGVKCQVEHNGSDKYSGVMTLAKIDPSDKYGPFYCTNDTGSLYLEFDECKPYLFPLSSMTEDQKYEFYLRFIAKDCDFYYFKFYLDDGKWHKLPTSLNAIEAIIDWFHKNNIDYRGLIPMGLAIDATGLNIY